MRTVSQVTAKLSKPEFNPLPVPRYRNQSPLGPKMALALPSMASHMSNEGWQLMQALEHGGFHLRWGTSKQQLDVRDLVNRHNPSTLVVQDKREWDRSGNLAIPHEYMHNIDSLQQREDIFKLTVLKDSHQRPLYHEASAKEIGCHAWITYYHPDIVSHLAPYVRKEHLIRTYHTVDRGKIPLFSSDREGCVMSGAIGSNVYPLRSVLVCHRNYLPRLTFIRHPGYHNRGTHTHNYLKQLSKYKVSICTSSIYGYSLRKIIESVACGCVVITDLPVDDVLPRIDPFLIRLKADTPIAQYEEIREMLPELYHEYDPDLRKHAAELAKTYYDYRVQGHLLVTKIETFRANYPSA